jgi:YHS domain-containing protein
VVTNANRLRAFRAAPITPVQPTGGEVTLEVGGGQPDEGSMKRDPVCGMDVDPTSAAGAEEHEGKTYYFCSRSCLERFRADPQRYASG